MIVANNKGMYIYEYIEEMVTMLSILSEINLIIDSFYLDNESDIKKQNCDLRKLILTWLEVCNAKPDIDNEQ